MPYTETVFVFWHSNNSSGEPMSSLLTTLVEFICMPTWAAIQLAYTPVRMNRDYEGAKLAEVYDNVRPDYPDAVRRVVLDCLEMNSALKARKHFLLDVGCGGGKSTELFLSDFDNILSIDISSAQIDVAKNNMQHLEHVQFQLVNDNHFPVEDDSVDVVLCATALHYLDLSSFYAECNRVLVDGGIVAVTVCFPHTLRTKHGTVVGNLSDDKCEYRKAFHNFFKSCQINDKPRERYLDLYKSIYDSIKNPTKRWEAQTSVELEWTVRKFLQSMETAAGYYSSSYQGDDPIVVFTNALSKIYQRLGLEFEMGAQLNVDFAMPVLIIDKKNGHEIM